MGRNTSAHSRGYDSRWQRARVAFLFAHPLCVMCASVGRVTAATVVDHVNPHRGDARLFWDEANWQPLCKVCHDSAKRKQDTSGKLVGCDAQGNPLDPGSHWHRT